MHPIQAGPDLYCLMSNIWTLFIQELIYTVFRLIYAPHLFMTLYRTLKNMHLVGIWLALCRIMFIFNLITIIIIAVVALLLFVWVAWPSKETPPCWQLTICMHPIFVKLELYCMYPSIEDMIYVVFYVIWRILWYSNWFTPIIWAQ